MKKPLMNQTAKSGLVLCLWLVLPTQRGAAQFVELTAEIETVRWSFKGENEPPAVHIRSWTTRCVVGASTWLIENDAEGSKETWSFAGTNITWQTLMTGYPSKHKELYERNHPDQIGNIGRRSTRVFESVDGNPGRAPLLTGPNVKIPWLAFCSGSYLKRDGRQIPLPSETFSRPFGYSDTITVFEDDLGLPKSVELYTTNNQPVCQYRAALSTNVMDWNFPLEFHLVQYRPAGTNGWELHLTAKGKVTAIGIGTKPQIGNASQPFRSE